MNSYHISGFPPEGTDDCKVIIFDNTTFNSPDAVKLAEPSPDKNGVVSGRLPRKWKGTEIQIVFISSQYVHENVCVKKTGLGFFHTMIIEKETNSDLDVIKHKWPVEPVSWNKTSQKLTMQAYRKARYKNYIFKFLYSVATITSCFVGYYIANLPGLLIGCSLVIFTIFISNYASGHEKII
ncbi:MAG: hypothetical protein GY829_01170 [Gammaproteobacteria bacterium]|nr:hypothetical protein [Gammaproteobacteria bacterium]